MMWLLRRMRSESEDWLREGGAHEKHAARRSEAKAFEERRIIQDAFRSKIDLRARAYTEPGTIAEGKRRRTPRGGRAEARPYKESEEKTHRQECLRHERKHWKFGNRNWKIENGKSNGEIRRRNRQD